MLPPAKQQWDKFAGPSCAATYILGSPSIVFCPGLRLVSTSLDPTSILPHPLQRYETGHGEGLLLSDETGFLCASIDHLANVIERISVNVIEGSADTSIILEGSQRNVRAHPCFRRRAV